MLRANPSFTRYFWRVDRPPDDSLGMRCSSLIVWVMISLDTAVRNLTSEKNGILQNLRKAFPS